MNRRNKLESATAEELVEYFVAIAVVQDKAMRQDDHAKYNRLYGEMDAVERELKQRTGDQRRALISLHEHPNAQVRLKAAIATLALAPDAARQALEIISAREEYPQAADARGMIRAVDDGSFIPS
jgi:hypothetical protein